MSAKALSMIDGRFAWAAHERQCFINDRWQRAARLSHLQSRMESPVSPEGLNMEPGVIPRIIVLGRQSDPTNTTVAPLLRQAPAKHSIPFQSPLVFRSRRQSAERGEYIENIYIYIYIYMYTYIHAYMHINNFGVSHWGRAITRQGP